MTPQRFGSLRFFLGWPDMQEKRYQIFLSSTFSDLEEERRKVMQTLLEMDCIPSGMEFFPASDEETFDFIKTIIDQSDYYILILSGRYGSLAPEGKSYTEKEYDYAVSIGKPILSFIRKDLSQVIVSKTDGDFALAEKLSIFREKVFNSGRLCRLWDNSDQLAGQVSTTLNTAIKRYPTTGWIRGNQIASAEILSEVYELRKENSALKEASVQIKPIITIPNLAELETNYEIVYDYYSTGYGTRSDARTLTWREISVGVLQNLTGSQTIIQLKSFLQDYMKGKIGIDPPHMSIDGNNMRQIVVQLELLGLIVSEQKNSELFFRTQGGKLLVYENLAVKGAS